MTEIHIPRKKVKFTVSSIALPPEPKPADLNAVNGAFDPVEVEVHKKRYHLTNICAHCTHWFIGRDKNIRTQDDRPACASPGPCGGLITRMAYPHYVGPLDDETLRMTCCVCGDPAPKSIRTSESGRPIGYCQKHLDEVDTLRAKDRR